MGARSLPLNRSGTFGSMTRTNAPPGCSSGALRAVSLSACEPQPRMTRRPGTTAIAGRIRLTFIAASDGGGQVVRRHRDAEPQAEAGVLRPVRVAERAA